MLRLRAPRETARLLSALALALALLGLGEAAAQQPLTPEQVVRLESVGQVALSPDGGQVAYTLGVPRTAQEEPGGSHSELHLLSLDGGASNLVVRRPLSASSPAWSPDGSRLAFVARLDDDERRQVYAVPAGGGEPRRLTASPTGVGAFEWSPAGDRIAYTASVPGPADADARRRRGDDVIVMSERFRPVRLWVQPLGEGEATAVTPAELTVRSFTWTPDGRALAVQLTEEPDTDAGYMYRDLFLVPAAGGALAEIGPTPGKVGDMAFSPDGTRLAYLSATSFNDPIAQSIFVVPAGGGAALDLTEGYEGTVTDVAWLGDGTVLFAADEGTRTVVGAVPADGGDIEILLGGGAEIFGSVALADDGVRLATSASTAEHPAEVFTGDLRSGSLERVTHHNPWLSGVALGEQRTIAWEGAEGWEIEGVLIEPVGFREGVRYPLAVLPHGGPEGISRDGWTTNPLYPAQVLAGEGYVVLMPNYRGSAGRGVAFSKADHRDLGGREFEDVLAGVDHLVDLGTVDPDRVGISGTSYGGYFSAWGATRHTDRFAAAIPFAGLTNWISFTNTTDIPVEMSAVHFDLWWFENPGLYMDRSPVSYAAGSRTPTLVGHGLADERVHPEQSLELYQALELNDVPTELVLYPREPHGLLERAHQLDFMHRILDWFGRYLKGEGPPVS